ncbi:MAG: hypothetical protein ABSH47_00025 [Bryobacteraceae bacterium]|jgi:hypothetical protein
MSTESQILANRRNAQASTGPRTAHGKSISSANALKHGLSAGFRVLQNENQDEFDDLIAELHRTFAPTNAYESILVDEMAHAHWRLARARRLEALMVDDMFAASPCSDADAALLSALLNNKAAPFVALQRYAAAAERSGYRALKQLLTLRRLEAQAARDSALPNEPDPGVSPDSTTGCHATAIPALRNEPSSAGSASDSGGCSTPMVNWTIAPRASFCYENPCSAVHRRAGLHDALRRPDRRSPHPHSTIQTRQRPASDRLRGPFRPHLRHQRHLQRRLAR